MKEEEKLKSNNYDESQYATMRTAFLTAFPKIFTDIEYSTEIFSNMKDLAIKNNFSFLPNHFSNEMSVEIEARHKALNKVLDKYISNDALIIEIATGLSPRRLQYLDYDYYELDYEPVIDIKKEIYSTLGYGDFNNGLRGIDITDTVLLHNCLVEIINAKSYSKVIILNEGLFWYLNREQIKDIANEFCSMLLNRNWFWITSDCPTKEKSDAKYRNIISNSAKVKRNTFSDYDDFKTFFLEAGLLSNKNKLSDFLSYQDLSSAKFLSYTESETLEKINSYTDIAVLLPE